jgi:hypothetical protein
MGILTANCKSATVTMSQETGSDSDSRWRDGWMDCCYLRSFGDRVTPLMDGDLLLVSEDALQLQACELIMTDRSNIVVQFKSCNIPTVRKHPAEWLCPFACHVPTTDMSDIKDTMRLLMFALTVQQTRLHWQNTDSTTITYLNAQPLFLPIFVNFTNILVSILRKSALPYAASIKSIRSHENWKLQNNDTQALEITE